MRARVGRFALRRVVAVVELATVLLAAPTSAPAQLPDATAGQASSGDSTGGSSGPKAPAPPAPKEEPKDASPQEPPPKEPEPKDAPGDGEEERASPNLVLKGFGDINFVYRDDDTPVGFSLGELDFFVTSELAPDLSVLAEIVFEPQREANPVIELERYMIRWAVHDKLQLALGRMHSSLGYWNQVYHHGAWFQTTIERPIVYRFEHDGGVLPVHEVGLSVLGTLPFSGVALEYATSVTNGRGADSHEVQEFRDANSSKAVNLWLGLVPRALRSLKLGGVLRFDRIPAPADRPETGELDERIAGGFVAFTPRRGEALAELLHVEHESRATGERWRTLGGYLQGALRLGRFKPYYRYDYQDVDEGDPYSAHGGTQSRHTLGVRYDRWSWAALKLEAYRQRPTEGATFNAVAFQAAFTF